MVNVKPSKRLRMMRSEFNGGLDRKSFSATMGTDSSLECTGIKGGKEVHREPDIHCPG